MEKKKSTNADLEKKRILFFEMGMILSLSLVLTAFEKIGGQEGSAIPDYMDVIPETIETIIPTQREKPELPPPPAAKFSNMLNLVDNNIDVSDIFIPTEQMEDNYNDIVEIDDPIDEPDIPDNIIIDIVEIDPSFPGGEDELYSFICKNIVYPRAAKEANIEGTVLVEFVVEPNGKISNVKAVHKVAPSLDEEAVRVVRLMPAWSPGKQRGKAVRTRFRLPILFSLH